MLARATDDFTHITRHIIAAYSPHRVWQWGSLIGGDTFRENSDIDIALEGVSATRLHRIISDAETMTRFPLHIMLLSDMDPRTQNLVRRFGRVVYERDDDSTGETE